MSKPTLGQVPAWCKKAIQVESRAIREKKLEEDRIPLDFRIHKGSAIGPLQFNSIVAFNWRTGEILPAKALSDGRKGGFKGASLCHKFIPYTPFLDSGKLKKGDDIELVAPKNLLEYSYEREKGTIAEIGENFILLKGPTMKAFPPKNKDKLYSISTTEDMNRNFHKALEVCEDRPRKHPEQPVILPAPPADAKFLLKGLDQSTIDAFTLAVSGNEIAGIQGPPGTGKTHLLAKVATYYIAKGLKVAILSLSHNAVINALNATYAELEKHNIKRPIFKNGDTLDGLHPNIAQMSKDTINPSCYGATLHAAAGFKGQATNQINLQTDNTFINKRRDVVLIDEAGQAPAYLVFALTFLAPKFILFGDQEQLPPIIQGQHIDNPTACSAMDFLIEHKGLEWVRPLLVSHRMNKEICSAIQTCFYPRLKLTAGTNAGKSYSPPPNSFLSNGGIDFVDVNHLNRSNRSPEEIDAVFRICKELENGNYPIPLEGSSQVKPDDIVVLTPFRCQKRGLESKLRPLGIKRIGTVHSMQGQGAPIVIFSLTSSSQQAIAQMSDWLFNAANWNVLISRAQVKVIIVGSLHAMESYHAESWEGLKCKNKILKTIIRNQNVCNITKIR